MLLKRWLVANVVWCSDCQHIELLVPAARCSIQFPSRSHISRLHLDLQSLVPHENDQVARASRAERSENVKPTLQQIRRDPQFVERSNCRRRDARAPRHRGHLSRGVRARFGAILLERASLRKRPVTLGAYSTTQAVHNASVDPSTKSVKGILTWDEGVWTSHLGSKAAAKKIVKLLEEVPK